MNENKTNINWYPGHMAKAKRKIEEDLKLIDGVIELLDSRIPISSRNPEMDEARECMDYLRTQVMLVKPKIVVLLGSIALKNILGEEYGITASRGKWIEKKGILYLPTWHPAALLRDESKKIDFWDDFKECIKKYGEIKGEN